MLSKKAKTALAEFYSTHLFDEFALTLKELNPLPALLADIVKELICITVESPQRTNHDFFCELLRHLSTSSSSSSSTPDDAMMVLSASDLQSAVYKFLAVLDDLIIDAPLAANNGAYVVAGLVGKRLLSLRLFATLPDDNDFSLSSRAGEFIVQVLQGLNHWVGPDEASALYKDSALEVKSFIIAPPRETAEDLVKAYAVKYSVPFIL